MAILRDNRDLDRCATGLMAHETVDESQLRVDRGSATRALIAVDPTSGLIRLLTQWSVASCPCLPWSARCIERRVDARYAHYAAIAAGTSVG